MRHNLKTVFDAAGGYYYSLNTHLVGKLTDHGGTPAITIPFYRVVEKLFIRRPKII